MSKDVTQTTEEMVPMSIHENIVMESAAALQALVAIARGEGDAQTIARQALLRLNSPWEDHGDDQ